MSKTFEIAKALVQAREIGETIAGRMAVVPPPIPEKVISTEFLSFRETTPALTAEHQIKRTTLTGVIHRIVAHFPAGCCGLIAIKVFHGGKQILPRMGVLALDNTTQFFDLAEPVKLGDPIRVDWENHDSTYSHTVPVIVGMKEGEVRVPEEES